MAVFDLHVHTVKGSSDSSLTPEQLIEEAQRIGLDGVCLTEHSGGWENHEFERVFQEAGITVVRINRRAKQGGGTPFDPVGFPQ